MYYFCYFKKRKMAETFRRSARSSTNKLFYKSINTAYFKKINNK